MKNLEKFIITGVSSLTNDELRKIGGSLVAKSKYWCDEDTSEGSCCDTQVTVTHDYSDGSTSE